MFVLRANPAVQQDAWSVARRRQHHHPGALPETARLGRIAGGTGKIQRRSVAPTPVESQIPGTQYRLVVRPNTRKPN